MDPTPPLPRPPPTHTTELGSYPLKKVLKSQHIPHFSMCKGSCVLYYSPEPGEFAIGVLNYFALK